MPNPRLSGGYAHAFASLPAPLIADAVQHCAPRLAHLPFIFACLLLILPLHLVLLFNCHLRVISLRSLHVLPSIILFCSSSFSTRFWCSERLANTSAAHLLLFSCFSFFFTIFLSFFDVVLPFAFWSWNSCSLPNPPLQPFCKLRLPNEFIKQENH